MLARFPQLTARELIVVLHKLGFECTRQRGSHMFFEHPDGRTTIVPNHAGETLDRGLLLKIIKQDLGLERNAFLNLL